MHQAVENAVAESQEAIQKILKEAEEACSQIREQAAQRKEEAVLAVIGKVVGEIWQLLRCESLLSLV